MIVILEKKNEQNQMWHPTEMSKYSTNVAAVKRTMRPFEWNKKKT